MGIVVLNIGNMGRVTADQIRQIVLGQAACLAELLYFGAELGVIDFLLDALNTVINESGWWYTGTSGGQAVFSGIALGDGPFSSLENFAAEYTGENTWRVTADFYLSDGTLGPERWYGWRMTADLVRNPNSCFDGYSVTGLDFTRTDTQWKQAYQDLVRSLSEDWGSGEYFRISLFYLDDDAIPELCIEEPEYQRSVVFATYHDGRCTWFEDGAMYLYGAKYMPGTGLLQVNLASLTEEEGVAEPVTWYGEDVYQLTGNEFQQIGEAFYETVWKESLEVVIKSVWNGQEVTKEEYDSKQDEIFPRDLARPVDSDGELGGWDIELFLSLMSR